MHRILKIDELKLITQRLLEIKSQKKDSKIIDMYTFLYPEERITSINKAFIKLIKIFHPDRIEYHNKIIKQQSQESIFFKNVYLLLDEIQNKKIIDYKIEENVNYSYDEDDFDDIIDINSYDYEFEDEESFNETIDFDLIDAFKNTFIGNDSNIIITPSMISMTSGYVDFSNQGINSLNGIEYYIYIERLNLNNNNIDSISGIEELHQLKELYLADNFIDNIDNLKELKMIEILDISNNEIHDIEPLLSIYSLKYVNLKNNKLNNNGIKIELEKKGVIVID